MLPSGTGYYMLIQGTLPAGPPLDQRAGNPVLSRFRRLQTALITEDDMATKKKRAAATVTSTVTTAEQRNQRKEVRTVLKPVHRRLRGYAFDPSLSIRLETALVNQTTYKVMWEDPPGNGSEGLAPGPVGEYLEVVDYDPASDCFYEPVNLNDPDILAQDGLPPSEGNPQFHQQMVYAVAMTTIRNFEKALGRRALWASRDLRGATPAEAFVQRLRVYPHALREANAYYSPEKRALLFGYFPASSDRPERYLPGGIVFTCLSHDIIAHEITHALLDGMHRRFIEDSHQDSLAFHEAFADIVALFQHFTFPEVLRHQIARTRGDLASQNLLGELAQEFGEAIGNYGALRSALGDTDPETGEWKPHKPNPDEYQTVTEPHARGAILVGAVFDAFLSIYKKRVADLLRIATSGTGVLPEGALHPDLVRRLANEAAKSAQHVLNVCIRALDYCPPVDISFGDYLRAIITADADLVPDDDLGYRVAFIEAFRWRGIYPRDVRALSVDSLRWPSVRTSQSFFHPLADKLRTLVGQFAYFETRRQTHEESERIGGEVHDWIMVEGHQQLKEFSEIAGITFEPGLPGLRVDKKTGRPRFQVHSVRPARRVGPDGDSLNQMIISLIQTRDIPVVAGDERSSMRFRGGSTLILDLDTMELKYSIRKSISDNARLERYKDYLHGSSSEGSPRATYFKRLKDAEEPFALLHRYADYGRP